MEKTIYPDDKIFKAEKKDHTGWYYARDDPESKFKMAWLAPCTQPFMPGDHVRPVATKTSIKYYYDDPKHWPAEFRNARGLTFSKTPKNTHYSGTEYSQEQEETTQYFTNKRKREEETPPVTTQTQPTLDLSPVTNAILELKNAIQMMNLPDFADKLDQLKTAIILNNIKLDHMYLQKRRREALKEESDGTDEEEEVLDEGQIPGMNDTK